MKYLKIAAVTAAFLAVPAAVMMLALFYLPHLRDLRALILAIPIIVGAGGGFYAGRQLYPRWLRAGAVVAALGLVFIAALLLSCAPRLLTFGLLAAISLLLLLTALPGALLGCGWMAAEKMRRRGKKA